MKKRIVFEKCIAIEISFIDVTILIMILSDYGYKINLATVASDISIGLQKIS